MLALLGSLLFAVRWRLLVCTRHEVRKLPPLSPRAESFERLLLEDVRDAEARS